MPRTGFTPRRVVERTLMWLAALGLAAALMGALTQGALADTFTVTNTQDSGNGSLRKAILDANGRVGADKVRFRIDGKGVKTIRPLTPLPTITDTLDIDGYTQTGSSRNTLANGTNAKLKVQLDGTNAGDTASGLVLTFDAAGSKVSGLVINRFARFGISVETGNASVSGNFVGTNAAGNTDFGNGGIGVNVAGSAVGNTIGGEFSGARNLISGNGDHGVRIDVANANVVGNRIGTSASGNADLGNALHGVLILGDNNTVGGVLDGEGNVISGNDRSGIEIADTGTGNVLRGNRIGTNAAGNTDLGNTFNGVVIDGPDNDVGGTASGAGNIISGNGAAGVLISDAFSSASGNTVLGNLVGTDATGDEDLGNDDDGVLIRDAHDNTVGGTASGARNVISGNDGSGVRIDSTGSGPATENAVLGNRIGTNRQGDAAIGNGSSGVSVEGNDNDIGGTASGAGNTITNNDNDGVSVVGGTGNSILGNSVFANGDLGIDLGTDSVTPNDGDNPLTPAADPDFDTGPNNFQNFPTISNVSRNASTLTASVSLTSTPRQTFTVQCFLTGRSPDISGHGEGRTLVDQKNVTTSAEGVTNFTCSSAALGIIARGQRVTATATNAATGDTSEFSANVRVP